MIEFNRQGFNKDLNIYESYYMADIGKKKIEKKENLKEEYRIENKIYYKIKKYKITKVNIHTEGKFIEAFTLTPTIVRIVEN